MKNDKSSPDHYKTGGLEVVDIWRAKLSRDEFRGLLKGNILKYLLRAGCKSGEKVMDDLQKCETYLNWLIEDVEDRGE